MKRKLFFLVLAVFFLIGCSTKNIYVDPLDETNSAQLSVDLIKLLENDHFLINITLTLDGKIIDSQQYPSMDVSVLPGKHKLSLEITAYYIYNNERRAKHNITKEFEIDFKANNKYIVYANVLEDNLKNLEDNVESIYSIQNSDIHINEKIVLEDSPFRSFRPSSLTPQQMKEAAIESAIDTVIILETL